MREGGDSEDETIAPLSDNEESTEAKLQVGVSVGSIECHWMTSLSRFSVVAN